MRLVLNKQGVNDLLHSPGVVADLRERADRVAAAAGEGMEVTEASDDNRARFVVVTATAEAIIGEASDRRLTRAIDAAR